VFEVYATVENAMQDVTDPDWKAVAEDVMATLSATGPVAIEDSASAVEPDLMGGESVTFTWTVTCTGWGDVVFTVTPDGIDENTEDHVLAHNVDIDTLAVKQEEKIHLTVTDVWTNLPNETIASTEQEFEVYATVENTMQDVTDPDWKAVAEDVMATLSATGDVDIPEPLQMSGMDLAGGESLTLTWTVTCSGWGDVVFTVTPDGTDENTEDHVLAHNVDPMDLAVKQEEKIHLTVTDVWTNLPNETIASTEQVFEVYATVENAMQDVTDPDWKAVAEDVMATLSATGSVQIEDPVSPVEPDLIGGESVQFTWTVTCTGPADVVFTVMPDGIDENTTEHVLAHNVDEGTLAVEQEWKAHLKVEIVEPEYGDIFSSDQEFVVRAIISNTGEADALDVEAMLSPLVGDGELVEGETVTKTVGTIPGYDQAVVTWTLRCLGSEQVHIWVKASGTDENTLMPIPEDNLEDHDIIVNQEWRAHLVADISTPVDGQMFQPGDTFVVAATVHNAGEATALDASVALSIEGPAQLISGSTPVPLGDMAEGAMAELSWTLECTGLGLVTITVTPHATDENSGADAAVTPDSVTVSQEIYFMYLPITAKMWSVP
jgi:hypothetical protein